MTFFFNLFIFLSIKATATSTPPISLSLLQQSRKFVAVGEVLVAIETDACCPSSLLFPLISLSLLSTFHHELSTYCTSHHSSCIQCMCAATESIFFRVSGTYPPLTTTCSAADAKPITRHVVYRHSAESPIQKMCKKFITHRVALFPPLLNFSASLTLVMYITPYLNVLHSGS